MGDRADAAAVALRILTRRDHSEAELRRKLQGRGFDSEATEAAVTKMKGFGYLDDSRFARQWAESAVRSGRGFGPRIKLELLQRGVAEAVIAQVLASVTEEYQERQVLETLVARKFDSFNYRRSDEREKRRVVAYLQRRGFSLSMILDVLHGHEGC
jgi:regulatory protein